MGVPTGLGGIGAGQQSLQDQLLSQAFGRWGQTAGIGADLSQNVFGRSLAGQQFGLAAGGQNVGQQVQMAGLPASLQGAYLQNALAALQGQGGLSLQALKQQQASITASTAQNQARTMTAAPLASFAGKAFGEVGGQAENLGALFTSIAGNKSATDAIGGALGGIFGGSNRPAPTNPNLLF